MGSALARASARAGLHTIGCDAFDPPHDRGSSHGESRIIRAAYFEDPIYAPLALRAMELWRELERETNRSLLRITGGVNIGPLDGMLVHGALTSARAHGIRHELLECDETIRRFPGFTPRPEDIAVYEPDAGVLNPEACIAAQLTAARTHGAKLRTNEPVVSWQPAHDSVLVRTRTNEFSARTLVLATGAWLAAHQPQLPLTVTRQPVFWFRPTEPLSYSADRLPHYLIEFERNRVFYGFPDLGNGVKCAIHHEGRTTNASTVDRSVTSEEVNQVQSLARQFLPGAAGPLIRHSVCLYTNSPSGHFIIARDPDHPAILNLSACSGHGFKFAPALAEIILNAIVNDEPLPAVFGQPTLE